PFRNWRIPWPLVWGVILGLGLYLLGPHLNSEPLEQAGVNLLYIFSPLMFIIGLAVVSWFFKAYRVSPFLILLLIVLFIRYPGFFFIWLILLGLFDPLLNFRARLAPKKKA
ncbi:MAG: YybS family protein, partial [Clostridiales bacterium]|nr:YybS family protein [Clostridiales bacterium]